MTRLSYLLLIGATMLVPQPAPGQVRTDPSRGGPLPVIGPLVQVSADRPDLPHVEPHLGVDPTNPERLYAASMMARPKGLTIDAFVSDDGGREWSRHTIPDCGFDPWIASAADGTGYLSCLAGRDALVFRIDATEGRWRQWARVPAGGGGSLDHTSIVVGVRDGVESISMVGMQGFELDVREYASPFVSPVEAGTPDSVVRTRVLMSDLWANSLSIASVDSFLVTAFADFSVAGRRPVTAVRFWGTRSRDGGATFSVPSLIAEVGASSTIPVLSVGGPGPSSYVVFDDVRGGRSGVWVARSDDAGLSWSDAGEVSTTDGSTKRHFNSQAAVDGMGTVLAAWYESPTDGNDRCFRVRAAASAAGGRTFGPAVDLTPEVFCVDVPGNEVEGTDGSPWSVARR